MLTLTSIAASLTEPLVRPLATATIAFESKVASQERYHKTETTPPRILVVLRRGILIEYMRLPPPIFRLRFISRSYLIWQFLNYPTVWTVPLLNDIFTLLSTSTPPQLPSPPQLPPPTSTTSHHLTSHPPEVHIN